MAEQTFIQVRIDSKLKQDATDVLNEIGMDMPNAIRMFLKRVVLEQGLPFDARLPAEARQLPDSSVEIIPAKQATYIPVTQFIALICCVPQGSITRWEDIDLFFKEIYHAQRIEVEPMAHWAAYWGDVEVPYWRIVGRYGFIPDDRRAGGREAQIKRLESEGLFIEPCGAGQKSNRVRDYQQYFYDFSQIDGNKIRQPEYGNTIYSAAAEMMMNPELYRGFTEHQLRQLASYNDGAEHNDQLGKCAEYAVAELKRRCMEI